MSRSLAIRCPECDASLKLPDGGTSRRSITCPKCRHEFAAPHTPPREPEPASDSPTGTIAVAETTTELPAQSTPVLHRARSSEEIEIGTSPVQALFAKLGDNAILYVLGGALGLLLIVYFSIFLSSPTITDREGTRFEGAGGSLPSQGTTNPVSTAANAVPSTPSTTTTTATPADANAQAPQNDPATATAVPAQAATHRLDLSYLPSDSPWIIALRPAELWGSPLLQGAFADAGWQSLAQFLSENFRLAITDAEAILLGLADQAGSSSDEPLSAGFLWRQLAHNNSVMTIRLRKPIDPTLFRRESLGMASVSYRDRKYFRGPALEEGSEPLAVLVDKSRLVLGRESSLRQAIDRYGKEGKRSELAFAETEAPLVVIAAPRSMSELALRLGSTSGSLANLQAAIASNVRALGVSFQLGSPGQIVLNLDCRDEAASSSVRTALEAWLSERKANAVPWPASVNPALGKLVDAAAGQVRVEQRTNVIQARAAFPAVTSTALAEISGWINPFAEDVSGGSVSYVATPPGGSRNPVTMLGVPDGLRLQAHTRWSLPTPGDAGNPATFPRLQIVFDLSGGPGANAMARSLCPLGHIRTDRSEMPAWRDDDAPRQNKGWLRIVRNTESPADGVRLIVSCDRPGQPPSSITEFEGSLTLRSGRDLKIVPIRNLRQFIGKTLPHPELKGCGLTFKVERQGDRLIIKARGRDTRLAGPGSAIDNAGNMLPQTTVEFVDSETELQFAVPTGEGTPDDVGLQLIVCSAVKDHVVPFRFERLEVPPFPKKQKKSSSTPGGTVAGTPAHATKIPGDKDQALPIAPAELMQAFVDDPSGATKKYRLQRMELTGVVAEVIKKGNAREIVFQVPQEGKKVSCDGFRDTALVDREVKPGDTVTVRGTFLGIATSDFVAMAQCELVAK